MTTALRTPVATELRRDILTTLLPGFDGPDAPDWLLALLRDGLGGVCLFGQNVATSAQLVALTSALREANPTAVVAIDEEGGDVTRLFYDRGAPWPGNAILGRLDDVELTEQVAREVGVALAEAGCTLTFAPDVDVNSDPDNPVIGVRSFGSDAQLAARHAAAWVRGLQSTGVAASAKHFPGHGHTSTDSHLAMPIVDVAPDVLRARELVPFRAAIAAGARTIMTSHILLPQLDAQHPATHSSRILQRLLRDELGFSGVIVTDALDMAGASGVHGIPEAAVRALAAGCDLLCIGSDNTAEQVEQIVLAIEDAVIDGRLPEARVLEAAARVRGLAASSIEMSGRADVSAAVGRQGRAVRAVGATNAATSAASRPASPAGFPAASPEGSPASPAASASRVEQAFDVTDVARARLAAADRIGTIVRVETEVNIAIGIAPWGPFAVASADAAAHVAPADARAHGATSALPSQSTWFDRAHLVTLSETSALDAPRLRGPVLVVGKNLHRHPLARTAIDTLRASRDDVVVVDMGWPGGDRAYADIATFGASRLVGAALIGFVDAALRTVGAGVA